MKLLYAEVISCGQEPDQKVLEQDQIHNIFYDRDFEGV